jgi:hypothetical protein
MEQQDFIQEQQPSEEALQAAKQNPGGWVYQVEQEYATSQFVPPEAIVGAWQVDTKGNIFGEFIPNPNYKPKSFQKAINGEDEKK